MTKIYIIPIVLLFSMLAQAQLKTVDVGQEPKLVPAGVELGTENLSDKEMQEIMKQLKDAQEKLQKRNETLNELYESM